MLTCMHKKRSPPLLLYFRFKTGSDTSLKRVKELDLRPDGSNKLKKKVYGYRRQQLKYSNNYLN